MQKIFEENQSKVLQGAIIWTPMLETDDLPSANRQEGSFTHHRVIHYWDPDRIFGSLLSQTLNLKALIAWDVYLIYPPDHPWDTELPPPPEVWMHQLDEEPTLFLDSVHFKSSVQAMIEKSS